MTPRRAARRAARPSPLLAALLALAAGACSPPGEPVADDRSDPADARAAAAVALPAPDPAAQVTSVARADEPAGDEPADTPLGLQLQLESVEPEDAATPRAQLAAAEPLSAADVERLLARLSFLDPRTP